MGSPADEPGRFEGEGQHQVTLSRPYCMKETEVTQAEWQSLMQNNPSYFASCGASCPVESVSWWDAIAYCNALSKQHGVPACYTLEGCTGTPGVGGFTCTGATFAGPSCKGYRLPTDAEWERAARAGRASATYNGTSTLTGCEAPNPVLDPIAWFCGNGGTTTVDSGTTKTVKGKDANEWGLYDMLGNVWEWSGNCLDEYPAGEVVDPTGFWASCDLRVARGGSWNHVASSSRAARRSGFAASGAGNYLGLRPVKTCQ